MSKERGRRDFCGRLGIWLAEEGVRGGVCARRFFPCWLLARTFVVAGRPGKRAWRVGAAEVTEGVEAVLMCRAEG